MTQGVIWRQLLDFSIPMAIGLLFQQLYNTVDTIVVGQFVGKEALAAVGSTSSIINMLVGFCSGLAIGASVVISQCYGSHDDKKLRDAVHTTIIIAFTLCGIMTALGLLIVDPALRLMATPDDVFDLSKQYLTIYFTGLTGLLIYNMGSGVLQAVGDSRRPLYFLCISAILNTLLDLAFVIWFKMGVAGVAWATIISQFTSALLVLIVLSQEDAPYGIRWRQLRLSREMLRRIVKIGMPSAIQQAVTSFSNVFVQGYINGFGSACMAGWASYNKLDALLLIPVQSIGMASTTFVGQNYGAGNLKRAKKGTSTALRIALIITSLCSLLIMVFAQPLLKMFSQDADVLDYGRRFTVMISPFYILLCFNQIYSGALRGIGIARSPVIVMIGSFVVFRQIYLYVNGLLGNSFVAVTLAYPVGWALCSLLLTILYRRSELCRPENEVYPMSSTKFA
ncbi:MAG: MATE family efflux transporter [Eubacteriales bacterium]|nr:MATE family efflux transporter [Eubacteriales bacterium]